MSVADHASVLLLLKQLLEFAKRNSIPLTLLLHIAARLTKRTVFLVVVPEVELSQRFVSPTDVASPCVHK